MGLLLLQGSTGLNPRELFSNGEQGLWLDPSDFSTMFQDSNGVTPVTASGQPVGLILDQSRGGLAALGSELWTNPTPTIANNAGSNGAYNSGTLTMTNSGSTASAYPRFSFNLGLTAGKFYRVTGLVTGNISKLSNVRLATSGTASNVGYSTTTGLISSITNAGASGSIEFVTDLTGAESITISSLSVREVPGNHAFQTTSAARPTLQTTGGLWYLSFDGSDDSLVTSSVDFTATNQMTVIAGVRKLSDAARGTVCELTATSASNNGAFHLTAPNAASATYAFESKGTLLTDGVASSVTAPLTSVISGSADISTDTNVIRVNGTQSDSDTGDQGTGNYSNAAIYIGRRGGSSLPFNGHIYQLIVRGKTTPTGKLLEAERFAGKKTGVSF